jgi:hypothetical protein
MDLNIKETSQFIITQDPSGTNVGQIDHGCGVLAFGGYFSCALLATQDSHLVCLCCCASEVGRHQENDEGR